MVGDIIGPDAAELGQLVGCRPNRPIGQAQLAGWPELGRFALTLALSRHLSRPARKTGLQLYGVNT